MSDEDDSGMVDNIDSDDDLVPGFDGPSAEAINNRANIARGYSDISSPEEEIIKARGRLKKDAMGPKSKDSVLLHLATRKSPRKPPSKTVNEFADDYFKSPTPKKARGTPKKSSKITPIKSSSDYKVNPRKAAFRKRLTLNASDSKIEVNSPRNETGSVSPSPKVSTACYTKNSSNAPETSPPMI